MLLCKVEEQLVYTKNEEGMAQLLEDAFSSLKVEFGKAFKSLIQSYTIPDIFQLQKFFQSLSRRSFSP
ncbi:MAG TPA: hypothetical protein DCE56_40770 [Cyanobacteria bacterium UBA8553]|nr:hypothetical protein [Cyanobacteria bacterium UBA8553]